MTFSFSLRFYLNVIYQHFPEDRMMHLGPELLATEAHINLKHVITAQKILYFSLGLRGN